MLSLQQAKIFSAKSNIFDWVEKKKNGFITLNEVGGRSRTERDEDLYDGFLAGRNRRPGGKCYETFYGRNLRIFVIS